MSGQKIIGVLFIVAVLLICWSVNAEEFCVGTAIELTDALNQAETNGESDIIKIQQGIYSGNFSFNSNQNMNISLLGGYEQQCISRVIDPINTVLDAAASGTPLSITKNGDGNVEVEGMTMRNGGYRGFYIHLYNDSGGNVGAIKVKNNIMANNKPKGGIYIDSSDNPSHTPGAITISSNVVSGNVSDSGAGGLAMQVQWGSSNDIIIANNLFVGNIGTGSENGGVSIYMGTNTLLYFVNNTVSGNHAEDTAAEVGGVYIGNSDAGAIHFYNNIIRDNSVGSKTLDLRFVDQGTRIGFNNNYSEINGTWTESGNNIDVDPQFILTGYWDDNGTLTDPLDDFWVYGDYHLAGISQCIDTGFETPPEFPLTDFEGDSRTLDGNNDAIAIPDIGADEYINYCEWDTDLDGDLDGIDLSLLNPFSSQIILSLFATNFGQSECLNGFSSSGVLRIHPVNPRYLTDGTRRAIYLSGSHTWLNIHTGADRGITYNDAASFGEFLDFMESYGHNFTRLWTGYSYLTRPPFAWQRPGPGTANDGGLKFNVNQFDQSYFDIVKERLTQLENRGLYASVMIFGSHNGFDLNFANIVWHPDNNINNLGLDTGNANSFFNLSNQALRTAQEALIRKFIDELNGFDNIIFEIMNEATFPVSYDWQAAMVSYAKNYESTKPKQHLWGITGDYSSPMASLVMAGPNDWWSPIWEDVGGYNYVLDGGPAAYSDKVVIVDSDHYDGGLHYPTETGLQNGISMAWRSFTRGNPFIFMECYTALTSDPAYGCTEVGINNAFDPIRDAMGNLLSYARRFSDLAAMLPNETLSSTGYALADPGQEYLIYQPGSGSFDVSLTAGTYNYEWFDAGNNRTEGTGAITVSSGSKSFIPPFTGQAVLYLWQ